MSRFTFGDTVRIKMSVPDRVRPGEIVAVVAVTPVERPDQAECWSSPIGTDVYTVEFADGSSVEIPDEWLEPHSEPL